MGELIGPNLAAVDLVERRNILTIHGEWEEFLFLYGTESVVVIALGDWTAHDVIVRVHSTCFSAHYLASTECDCREQLEIAMLSIKQYGRGIIVFLDQDGRGNGHAAIMRTSKHAKVNGCTQGESYEALGYPRDARSYRAAASVLKVMGITSLSLMTNNPAKISALAEQGILVSRKSVYANDHTERLSLYYKLKGKEGHILPEVHDE